MTQGDDTNATWLPNLVGGVSIWKLGVDLNEPKFFDGRLLVPETEGSESLPVSVRWDLTDLVPLGEARSKWPADTDAAISDFQSALGRVAKVFGTPNSGFDKYKQAFTVPSLEANGGGNYFYAPASKKLFVINWGASPRSMGGRAEYVFGYEDWGKAFRSPDASAPGVGALSAASAAATVAGEGESDADAKKKDADAKKKPEKKRAWWFWPLFALVAIALVLLALFFLRACEEPRANGGPDAEALADGAADGAADATTDAHADAHATDDDGGTSGDGGDAAADGSSLAEAGADAGDGGSDAGDAGDAGTDGGRDAGRDGGLAADDDDSDDDDDGADGAGGAGAGGAGAGGGGKVIVTLGPAAGGGGKGGGGGASSTTSKAGPHRRHYQADAVKWRVAAGNEKIARTEQRGHRYDVWLGVNKTFEGVRVEWQDKAGKWHVH